MMLRPVRAALDDLMMMKKKKTMMMMMILTDTVDCLTTLCVVLSRAVHGDTHALLLWDGFFIVVGWWNNKMNN
jgi:hypothetical protein